MQLVVCSDAHGRDEVFPKLRFLHPHAQAYLHCGDAETDEERLDGFVNVQGNNDPYGQYPNHVLLDLGGLRVYMQHGDRIPYMSMTDFFLQKAKDENCQLFIYGHTHIFNVVRKDGIVLVNPGSIYHNRDGSAPSYALITIENGDIDVKRMELPRESNPKKKHNWF